MSDQSPNNQSDAVAPSQSKRYQLEAEQLADNINHSAGIARGLFLVFIGFAAFLLVTTNTTNDFDLLLQTPIELPIFGVSVDLPGFYRFAPWAFFFVHVNMMMTLVLISNKLATFHSKLSIQPYAVRELLRARLHVFAPVQYLSRQHSGVLQFLLWLISRVMLVWMPPALLLWLQIDSLAMQDSLTVWSQRIVVLVDAVMTYFLWGRMFEGRARPLSEVRLPGSRRPVSRTQKWNKFSTSMIMLFIFSLSFFGATVPLSSWEQATAFTWKDLKSWQDRIKCDPNDPQIVKYYPDDCNNPISRTFFDGVNSVFESSELRKEIEYYERKISRLETGKNKLTNNQMNPKSTEGENEQQPEAQRLKLKKLEKRIVKLNKNFDDLDKKFAAGNCRFESDLKRILALCWFVGSRWLDELHENVQNRIITAHQLDPGLQNNLGKIETEFDEGEYENLMNQIIGVDLRKRSLVMADFSNLIMPKAKLDQTKLQGANLDGTQLRGAKLEGAQLQGVRLGRAQLQNAILKGVQLQGMNLFGAQLRGAILDDAKLQGVSLDNAQLQGASLVRAQLQGASLDDAQLQGAKLINAQLQGAHLDGVQLQAANLDSAQLQGAHLDKAQLQWAYLDSTQLEGARLHDTEFQGALLNNIKLSFAYIYRSTFDNNWKDKGEFVQGLKKSSLDETIKSLLINHLNEKLESEESFEKPMELVGKSAKSLIQGIPGSCIAIRLNGDDQDMVNEIYEFCETEEELKLSEKEKNFGKEDEELNPKLDFVPIEKFIQRSQFLCEYRQKKRDLHDYIWSGHQYRKYVLLAPHECEMNELFLDWLKSNGKAFRDPRREYPIINFALDGKLSSVNCTDLKHNNCRKIINNWVDEKSKEFLKSQMAE